MTMHDKGEGGSGQAKSDVIVFVWTLLDSLSGDDLSSSVLLTAISRVLYLRTLSNGFAIFI